MQKRRKGSWPAGGLSLRRLCNLGFRCSSKSKALFLYQSFSSFYRLNPVIELVKNIQYSTSTEASVYGLTANPRCLYSCNRMEGETRFVVGSSSLRLPWQHLKGEGSRTGFPPLLFIAEVGYSISTASIQRWRWVFRAHQFPCPHSMPSPLVRTLVRTGLSVPGPCCCEGCIDRICSPKRYRIVPKPITASS